MPRTVHLHIGTAKSGTTYLQRLLFQNRHVLRDAGVLYPGQARSAHFLASMDVRSKRGPYPEAEGVWPALVDEVSQFSGDAVISHETLSFATKADIDHVMASFPDHRVRVVLTCRDLGRQLPAAWQERVKNRRSDSYSDFLRSVVAGWTDPEQRRFGGLFWPLQDYQNVIGLWGPAAGPGSVRVVTVPPPGAERGELWRRFAAATELPEREYVLELPPANPSLGAAESELLRRMNSLLRDDISWREHERLVKGRFVRDILSQRRLHGHLVVPAELRDPIGTIAEQLMEFGAGPDGTVVGDVADLRPAFQPEGSNPDDLSESDLLEAALRLLADTAVRPAKRNPSRPGGPPARRGVQPAESAPLPPGRLSRAVRRIQDRARPIVRRAGRRG